MSTTERVANLRQTLKTRHGWNARMVSLRTDYYSMGCTVHATIRDLRVSERALRLALSRDVERIDYDHATGEILSGGNTFVDIHYSADCLRQLAEMAGNCVAEAYRKAGPGAGCRIEVPQALLRDAGLPVDTVVHLMRGHTTHDTTAIVEHERCHLGTCDGSDEALKRAGGTLAKWLMEVRL